MNIEEVKRIVDNELETPFFCFGREQRVIIDRENHISNFLLTNICRETICNNFYQDKRLVTYEFNCDNVFDRLEYKKIDKYVTAKYHPISSTHDWLINLSNYFFEKDMYICIAKMNNTNDEYLFILRKVQCNLEYGEDIYKNYCLRDFDGELLLSRKFKPFYKCKVNDCNNGETEGIEFPHCNKCKKVKYCSRNCQVKDWKNHKLICKN